MKYYNIYNDGDLVEQVLEAWEIRHTMNDDIKHMREEHNESLNYYDYTIEIVESMNGAEFLENNS